jgi:hypothetical protein
VVLNRSRCNTRPNSGPEDDSFVGGTEKGKGTGRRRIVRVNGQVD